MRCRKDPRRQPEEPSRSRESCDRCSVVSGVPAWPDGGLVSPTPVRYVRQMGAEVVIAVDISSAPEGNQAGDPIQILLQTFAIMGKSINGYELREADLVVRPALAGVGGADFTARRRAIEAPDESGVSSGCLLGSFRHLRGSGIH